MSVQIIFLDCLIFEDRRIGVDWENSERIVSMSGFLNYQTMGGNDGATGATLATYCIIVSRIFPDVLINGKIGRCNRRAAGGKKAGKDIKRDVAVVVYVEEGFFFNFGRRSRRHGVKLISSVHVYILWFMQKIMKLALQLLAHSS
ncbi:hypothetical protein B0H10DRAFT_1950931 [Mycena sp. CBHHK59/15]|nr:hypothetical protein B0H10DRAFT_1950931 [Mycena sp. CBHHK59/15]